MSHAGRYGLSQIPDVEDEASFDSCDGFASGDYDDNELRGVGPLEPTGANGSDDLTKYSVASSQVRKLVRAYRYLSNYENMGEDTDNDTDPKKAFALFEMRSRIME